jgi:hypothetical protein
MPISRFHHPISTKLALTLFVVTGVGMLWMGLPVAAAALVFYGAGNRAERYRWPSLARIAMPRSWGGSPCRN